MEWLTLGSYLLMSWYIGWFNQDPYTLNSICLYIISMHQIGQNNCFILYWLLCLLVYIWISCKCFLKTLKNILNVNFLVFAHWFMSISISHMKYHSIPIYHARYPTYIMDKYLDTATFKKIKKFYKTTFPPDML